MPSAIRPGDTAVNTAVSHGVYIPVGAPVSSVHI